MSINLDQELGLISEAEYLKFRNISRQTARNERSARKGPAYTKSGRTVKYYISGVKQYIEARTVTPRSTPTMSNAGRRGR